MRPSTGTICPRGFWYSGIPGKSIRGSKPLVRPVEGLARAGEAFTRLNLPWRDLVHPGGHFSKMSTRGSKPLVRVSPGLVRPSKGSIYPGGGIYPKSMDNLVKMSSTLINHANDLVAKPQTRQVYYKLESRTHNFLFDCINTMLLPLRWSCFSPVSSHM